MEPTKSNKPVAAAEPFRFFSMETRRVRNGLVIRNWLLYYVISLTSTYICLASSSSYVYLSLCLLLDLQLPMALGIMAFMAPFFIVIWRAVQFCEVALTESYAMGPADCDTDGKKTTLSSKDNNQKIVDALC